MKRLLFGICTAILCFGGFAPAFAADDGGKTLDFHKNSILDPSYKQSFGSDWFFKPGSGNSIEEIRRLFYHDILPKFKYLFFFVGLLFWGIYITYAIGSLGDEEKISQQRKTILKGIIGFAVISLAVEFGRVLTPIDNGDKIVDIPGVKGVIQKIAAMMQVGVGLVALIMIFYAAVRFIRANGEEDETTAAKNNLKWGFLGMIFAILAEPLITTVFSPKDETFGREEIQNFARESAGFLKFALTFLAVFAFAALVIAGFYLITSYGDEERQSKAKTIVWATLLGLLIIALSYTLVVTLVPTG